MKRYPTLQLVHFGSYWLSFVIQLVIVDVYNSRFHRIYGDRDSLSHILERDDICGYELGAEKASDNVHYVHVPVYHRESTYVLS